LVYQIDSCRRRDRFHGQYVVRLGFGFTRHITVVFAARAKAQVAVIWTRYRDMTRQMTAGPWSAGRNATNRHGEDDNVVDVQVKEVHERPPSLVNRD